MRLHSHPDAIADCVLNAFHALPPKFKPRKLADGRREWVPLAGIVLSRQQTDRQAVDNELKCVSLATGMKCLPHSKVKTAKGNILHDSHAEVLAIRGFNRWLVGECHDLAKSGFGNEQETDTGERWIRWAERGKDGGEPPFELEGDVDIHMYCSEAPCGDASMELVMREQEDDTPWDRLPSSTGAAAAAEEGKDSGEDLLGRGYFDRLGVVRRKPARPDAPITLSKSCSDKLAMKQCTGLLSAVTTRLVRQRGTWMATLTLQESQVVDEAVERCFGKTGRMAPLLDDSVQERWKGLGFEYRPFEVLRTGREFEYSRRALTSTEGAAAVPSNLCAVVTPQKQEVLINGVLQGRKQDDPKGPSCVSRRRMWEAANAVLAASGMKELGKEEMYDEIKKHGALRDRKVVKEDVRTLALRGWRKNEGDEGWRLNDGL